MESVRRALPDDLPRLSELLADARHAADGAHGGRLLLADALPTVAETWAGPAGHMLLAGLFEGVVVGVGAGHLRENAAGRVGRIDWCYVEPGARQVGVGSALATALVRWFAESGCTDVDAPALPGDRETKQLFERAGFSARLLLLHHRLP